MKNVSRILCLLPLVLLPCSVTLRSTPAAAQSPAEVSTKIRLSGAVLNGFLPEGSSEFRSRSTRRTFKVEANRVNLPDGTVLNVLVNGKSFGTITLFTGKAALELESERRQSVPSIQKGDVVTLNRVDGSTLLRGAF